jgi:hypothetical protein
MNRVLSGNHREDLNDALCLDKRGVGVSICRYQKIIRPRRIMMDHILKKAPFDQKSWQS